MIVITGANGALNGATVEHLLERVPAERVGVCVRDAARARHLAERGVRVRQGSYQDPAALRAAFAGAEQLLLVSSNERTGDPVELHCAAVAAAVEAGVGRILYTSHQGAGADSPFEPCRVHAATEEILAGCGVPWTALRNGFYAHTLPMLLGPWRETGVVAAPADGPVSWTARADSAEAAAVVLAQGRACDGPMTITAPAAPTLAEVAALLSEREGREVRRVVVDDDEWVAGQVAQGVPEAAARFTLGIPLAAREGRFAGVDPLLPELLGREPRSVAELFVAA